MCSLIKFVFKVFCLKLLQLRQIVSHWCASKLFEKFSSIGFVSQTPIRQWDGCGRSNTTIRIAMEKDSSGIWNTGEEQRDNTWHVFHNNLFTTIAILFKDAFWSDLIPSDKPKDQPVKQTSNRCYPQPTTTIIITSSSSSSNPSPVQDDKTPSASLEDSPEH